MPNVSAKNAAIFAGGVLLTMLFVNTMANRVELVKKARAKIDAGL